MLSFRKQSTRKKVGIVMGSLLVCASVLFAVTKVAYDVSFPRYDAVSSPKATAREGVTFLSGEHQLRGYRYGHGEGDLVVLATGYRSVCDDYADVIASLQDSGWDVFVFDSTGSGESEGESAVGFSQALLDLDAALTYAEQTWSYDAFYLLGHSRGGWAACGLLASDHPIAAVVSVAGVNSPMEAVIEPATKYVGVFAYGNYPFLWLYQTMLFGADAVNRRADEAINASDVPVLLVQGTADTVATPQETSIVSHRATIRTEDVEYVLCDAPGRNGHTDVLYTSEGANEELMCKIDRFFAESGRK